MWERNFYWPLKIQILHTACDLSHPLKLRNLILCNTQWYAKIKFLETIYRKKHSWKESYRFVIAHLAFFHISFKSTIMRLKIYVHVHFKKDTLKILHF